MTPAVVNPPAAGPPPSPEPGPIEAGHGELSFPDSLAQAARAEQPDSADPELADEDSVAEERVRPELDLGELLAEGQPLIGSSPQELAPETPSLVAEPAPAEGENPHALPSTEEGLEPGTRAPENRAEQIPQNPQNRQNLDDPHNPREPARVEPADPAGPAGVARTDAPPLESPQRNPEPTRTDAARLPSEPLPRPGPESPREADALSKASQSRIPVEATSPTTTTSQQTEDSFLRDSGTPGRSNLPALDPQAQPTREGAESFSARIEVPVAPGEVIAAARGTPVAPAATRVVPELPPTNESEILQQVRILQQRGGGQARIELHPPQLGGLDLRLLVTNDQVQLTIVADRAGVAELLARHLPELRQALESQGLSIQQANVEVRDSEDSDRFRPRDSRTDDPTGQDGRHRPRSRSSPFQDTPPLPRGLQLSTLGTVDLRV